MAYFATAVTTLADVFFFSMLYFFVVIFLDSLPMSSIVHVAIAVMAWIWENQGGGMAWQRKSLQILRKVYSDAI